MASGTLKTGCYFGSLQVSSGLERRVGQEKGMKRGTSTASLPNHSFIVSACLAPVFTNTGRGPSSRL